MFTKQLLLLLAFLIIQQGGTCAGAQFTRSFQSMFHEEMGRLRTQQNILGLIKHNWYSEILTTCQDIPSWAAVFPQNHPQLNALVDPDGSGSIEPFPVKCVFNRRITSFMTIVHHNQEARTHVDGYERVGDYQLNLMYQNATLKQVAALVDKSANCKQLIRYECKGSLLSDAFWKDRNGVTMKQWSGSKLSTGKFACAPGKSDRKGCPCQINDNIWRLQNGYVEDKKHLPISVVSFGDTGARAEEGYHTIGPLICTK